MRNVQVEDELNGLMALLPGLQFRFERMKADLVIKLVTQRQRVAECLVALRAALPSANIASIATTLPSLLTTQTPEELAASVQSIRYRTGCIMIILLIIIMIFVLVLSCHDSLQPF